MPRDAQSKDEVNDLSPATYADLNNLDDAFDSIDAITTAFQETISKRFYEKRTALAQRIPNFWPLVFEQAPPEVDQYIQPSDSNVLVNHLTGFSVERFESKPDPEAFSTLLKRDNDVIDEAQFGEPRSTKIRFEFAENEYFEDKVIEKKFWYRRSIEGEGDDAPIWAGRISEPVKIHWKKGKDLTNGMTDAACELYDAQKSKGLLDAKDYQDAKAKAEESKKLPEFKSLMERVDKSTEGSQSFFTWFSYHGPWISTAQDQQARAAEKKQRETSKPVNGEQANGGAPEGGKDGDEDIDDLNEMPDHFAVEVFPDGQELALALAEDIWPNAIELFKDAQEGVDADDMTDGSFDDADLEDMDEESIARANMEEIKALSGRKREEKETPPAKKRKT